MTTADLAEAVAADLTAAGERPAARHESGWKITAGRDSVLVNYDAAGAGEAVMKREALIRWMPILAAEGRIVTGHGTRKLAFISVAATAAGKGN